MSHGGQQVERISAKKDSLEVSMIKRRFFGGSLGTGKDDFNPFPTSPHVFGHHLYTKVFAIYQTELGWKTYAAE